MTSHLEEKLQNDSHRIRDRVREMADLALRRLEDSVRALTTGDTKLAYAAILRDSRVDDLDILNDGMGVEFIVRHLPVATHLRFVHSKTKIVSELERGGDKPRASTATTLLTRTEKLIHSEKFERISGVAINMMRQAVRSFFDEDLDLARHTIALESRANGLHRGIHRELGSKIPVQSEERSRLFSLLSVANRHERVADQAVNIGETLVDVGLEALSVLFDDLLERITSLVQSLHGTVSAPGGAQ